MLKDEQYDVAHAYALGFADANEVNTAMQLRADPVIGAEFEFEVRRTREALATLTRSAVALPPPGLRSRILAWTLRPRRTTDIVGRRNRRRPHFLHRATTRK